MNTLTKSGLAWLLILFVAPALAGPYDGYYRLDGDPGVAVRVITEPSGNLLLTAEGAGTTVIPPDPSNLNVNLHVGRYLNGRFIRQSDRDHYEYRLSESNSLISYSLILAPDGSGIKASWIRFPDPAFNISMYRKDLRLTRATPPQTSTLPQDLAGRWTTSGSPVTGSVLEIFASGNALTVYRSDDPAKLKASVPENFQPGAGPSFNGPLGLVIQPIDAARLSFNDGRSKIVFTRDPATPASPQAGQRVGVASRNEQGETVLHIAARNGDLARLNQSLSVPGIDINAVDNAGNTALHVALANGRVDIVQSLLRGRASTSIIDRSGKTAPQLAASSGDVQSLKAMQQAGANMTALIDQVVRAGDVAAVRTLLSASISAPQVARRAIELRKIAVLEEVFTSRPDAVTMDLYVTSLSDLETARTVISYFPPTGLDKNAALSQAIQRNQFALVPDLIQAGAKPDNAMIYAVRSNNLQLLTQLVEMYGADPNAALIPAVQAGNLPIMDVLLLNGADPSPALSAAVENGNAQVVTMLLDKGASPDAALAPAVKARKAEVAKLLIAKGADGSNPALLTSAAGNGDDATVAVLLDAGATPQDGVAAALNARSAPVLTRLMNAGADASDPKLLFDAARKSSAGPLRVILAAGGDPNMRDDAGRPLIVIAAASADVSTLLTLLQAGADKEAADSAGTRAIHAAVVRKDDQTYDLVDTLIKAGVDINAPNGKGELPRALSHGIKVPWILRQAGAKKSLDD